jgi:hypothetical protein
MAKTASVGLSFKLGQWLSRSQLCRSKLSSVTASQKRAPILPGRALLCPALDDREDQKEFGLSSLAKHCADGKSHEGRILASEFFLFRRDVDEPMRRFWRMKSST